MRWSWKKEEKEEKEVEEEKEKEEREEREEKEEEEEEEEKEGGEKEAENSLRRRVRSQPSSTERRLAAERAETEV